jgi:ribosomal protein L29
VRRDLQFLEDISAATEEVPELRRQIARILELERRDG